MGGSGKGAVNERYAKQAAAELAQRIGTRSVGNAATAGALGDFFQYVIDHPVTLNRQKSALLPIVGKDIESTRLSIYNESVQVKHPLLGLRFKNTTGAHLNQGPVTVFEGSVYAGDTQVLNVQPNEERLLSYAIDLGTEVDPQGRTRRTEDYLSQSGQGHRYHHHKSERREDLSYRQPLADGPDVVDRAPQPDERGVQARGHRQAGRGHARRVPVPDSGEGRRNEVVHGQGRAATSRTRSSSQTASSQLHYVVNMAEASPGLKHHLLVAINLKRAWDGVRANWIKSARI